MASLYQQPKSPFWWVKFRDPTTGKTVRKSTRFRIGDGTQTRKARQFCAERTSAENAEGAATSGSAKERWANWVPPFLLTRYGPKARFISAWYSVNLFLEHFKIATPRELTREHCMSYVEWRKTPDARRGKRKAGTNTAILEIKLLALVMKEAVGRRYAQHNPCRELGFKRERNREKPELTDDDFAIIEAGIAKETDPDQTFYRNSFLISRYQGCRLSETHLNPASAVDLREGTIAFNAKGGRLHVAPLHPQLRPLFEQLIAKGAKETYIMPKSATKKWTDFLRRCGLKQRMPGVCFHSLRVTVATRLARSGKVSEAKAMRFIGHASSTVHRMYQRLRLEDLGDCLDAVS